MRIAFLGYGNVGAPLADALQRLGHAVVLAVREAGGERLTRVLAKNPALEVAAPKDAVRDADVVFLATPFGAVEAALGGVLEEIRGKVVVDCTNPVGAGISHGLKSERSGTEVVQALAPESRVVKAFTIYGFENFEDNRYPGYGVKPVMMYCGKDAAAKATVGELIASLGWEPLDVGGVEQAVHLEHMTLLWVRMVRVNQASPQMVWGVLRRQVDRSQ